MAHQTSFLERYRAGEYEQVWDELVTLGEQVHEEPLYSGAVAVARETMRRVRHNILLLIPRLRDLGYVFGHAWAVPQGALTAQHVVEFAREYPPLDPPAANTAHLLAEVERRAGPLPLSLRAFYEIVGGVNLIGAHPVWDASRLDPLEVDSARAVLHRDDLEHWSDDRQEDGSCELPIAPDEYFKYRRGPLCHRLAWCGR